MKVTWSGVDGDLRDDAALLPYFVQTHAECERPATLPNLAPR